MSKPASKQQVLNAMAYYFEWSSEYLKAIDNPTRRQFLREHWEPKLALDHPNEAIAALTNQTDRKEGRRG